MDFGKTSIASAAIEPGLEVVAVAAVEVVFVPVAVMAAVSFALAAGVFAAAAVDELHLVNEIVQPAAVGCYSFGGLGDAWVELEMQLLLGRLAVGQQLENCFSSLQLDFFSSFVLFPSWNQLSLRHVSWFVCHLLLNQTELISVHQLWPLAHRLWVV